eukprot:scaffold65312_cov33-Tisochrysis_lutea.AAC.3
MAHSPFARWKVSFRGRGRAKVAAPRPQQNPDLVKVVLLGYGRQAGGVDVVRAHVLRKPASPPCPYLAEAVSQRHVVEERAARRPESLLGRCIGWARSRMS